MLHTKRLTVRPINEEDLIYLLEMNNDYDTMQFISSQFQLTSANQECQSIKKQIAYYKENPGFGLWMLDTDEDTIGWVSLKYNEHVKGYEIGYRLRKAFWNKGYATEAVAGVLDYAKEKELECVYAVAMKTNVASLKVMQKVGMTFDREDYLYNEYVYVYKRHFNDQM